MKKIILLFFTLFSALLHFLFAFSCSNSLSLSKDTEIEAPLYESVQINIINNRTETPASYYILAQKEGENDVTADAILNSVQLRLTIGQWLIRVYAKNGSGEIIGSGFGEIIITEGVNALNIGIATNSGALKYTISYNLSGVVSKLKITLSRAGFNDIVNQYPVSKETLSSLVYLFNVYQGTWSALIEGLGDDDIAYFSKTFAQNVVEDKLHTNSIILDQIKVTPVNISLNSGIYGTDQDIVLSCLTSGVNIRYLLSDTTPDDPTELSGAVYSSPILLNADGIHKYLKVCAYKDGLTPSVMEMREYRIIYLYNIETYFTNPNNDTSIDDILVDRINRQSISTTLDVCFYGFDREIVIQALEAAINRGVRVRFVGNKDGSGTLASLTGEYYEGYYRIATALDNKFPVSGKQRINWPIDSGFDDFNLINNAIMHNKFVLLTLDNGEKILYTGSTNCTDSCFTLNNNNSLFLRDEGIFSTYFEQFEYLLGLPGKLAVTTVRTHYIDNIKFEVFFAPNYSDGISAMDQIMNRVTTADGSIYFMIFSFPHVGLNNLLLNKFSAGLTVKGVFDESQLANSQEEFLAQRGIPCRIDGNYFIADGHGGKLHHKTMIVDYDQNDAFVVTGSFNWSDNANDNNNENILIIHSKAIAAKYKAEWDQRWNEGTDVPTVPPGDDANYQDVVVSEVMWMGSQKTYFESDNGDEFIELYNRTSSQINLTGWAIMGAGLSEKPIVFPENSYIEANSYLVVLSKSKYYSCYQPTKYIVNYDLSVSNSLMLLTLTDPDGTVIDYAGDGGDPANFSGYNGSGDGAIKKSMSRKTDYGDGKVKDNWFTSNSQNCISDQYEYLAYNCATPGSDNVYSSKSYNQFDLVFSEIAWAGTDASWADEWIEIYNNTTNDVNLIGWSIKGDFAIELGGVIPAKGYYLLERTDESTVLETSSDMIYTGNISNDRGYFVITYNDNTIDILDMNIGWAEGSSSPHLSMERIDTTIAGDNTNWKSGIGDTEGAQNSAGGGTHSSEIIFNPLDLVVLEIAWAGTDTSTYDEWIELYNNTSSAVDLAGWILKIDAVKIYLSGTIPANKSFLLERGDDSSVPDLSADMIYSATLGNTGGIVELLFTNRSIDLINMPSGWAEGSSTIPRLSMERIDYNTGGSEISNWKDASGDVEGAQNSFY